MYLTNKGSSKEEIEKMIHSALRLEEPESNTKFRCGVCSFESASIPYVLEHLKTHHEFITNKDEFILPIRFEEFPNTTIELVQDSHRENSQGILIFLKAIFFCI